MSHLCIFVKVIILWQNLFLVDVFDDTVSPGDETVEDTASLDNLCVCVTTCLNGFNRLFVIFLRGSNAT